MQRLSEFFVEHMGNGISPRVPFNLATCVGTEREYVNAVLDGSHLSGDGPYTKACQALLEGALGVNKVLLTTNCTHALEMMPLILDIGAGDEVIMPSFTFVSTANAFVLQGAKPVFVDIRPDTMNIDERLIEAAITKRTKAIVVVHYAGVACDMDVISEIAHRHGIHLLEDNAHGLFGLYKGRPLGSIGTIAAQSFHETKNFTCGEGGALVLNDASLIETAEIVREKGTNRSRFYRGQIDKYSWVGKGSSYLPAELPAAYLLGQLEAKEHIQGRRAALWERYSERLAQWARLQGVQMPHIPSYATQSYHMFYLVLPSLTERQRFMAYLRERSINTAFHYVPLHQSEMARRLGAPPAQCPVTERISDRLVRLPFFTSMTAEQQNYVTDVITSFEVSA